MGKALGKPARSKSVRARFQEGLAKLARVQEKFCTFPPKPLLTFPSYFTLLKALSDLASMKTSI